MTTVYTYKDYKYVMDREAFEDNTKTYHFAISTINGVVHQMPVSSYLHTELDISHFEKWIDMGLPDESKLGGKLAWHIDHKKFAKIYENWLEQEATKQLELALELEQE